MGKVPPKQVHKPTGIDTKKYPCEGSEYHRRYYHLVLKPKREAEKRKRKRRGGRK